MSSGKEKSYVVLWKIGQLAETKKYITQKNDNGLRVS